MQTDTSSNTDAAEPSRTSAALTRKVSAYPPRPPGAARWQSLAALAGLCLAATCFLPAVQSCNAPLVPINKFGEALGSFASKAPTGNAIAELLICFCFFILAYLFGALEALSAFLRRFDRNDWSRRIAIATAILLCLTAVCVLTDTIVLDFLLVTFVSALVLIHTYLSRRQARWRWLCQSFLGSTLCLIWFSFWSIVSLSGGGRYGLYLSWFSSAVLTLAVVGEARAVSRLSWFWTIVGLFVLRLHRWALPPGHCLACGYNLFGLTRMRCPECGRPFTFDELGVSPDQLGYRSADTQTGPATP
jgi:hypothetical protein